MIVRILFILLCVNSISSFAKFSHESEASLISSTGNSPFETYNLKTTNNYEIFKQEFIFGGHYQLGTIDTSKIEIARNWDFNVKAARNIDKVVEGFFGAVVEGDRFAGFSERNNIDIGLVWKHINTDEKKFRSELGYRQTVETPVGGSARKDSKLRIYSQYEDKFNENVLYKFWIELLPNFTTPKDYMITFEPSIQVTLTKIFSLKVSYKGAYDNMPAVDTRINYDALYSTSLIAKF